MKASGSKPAIGTGKAGAPPGAPALTIAQGGNGMAKNVAEKKAEPSYRGFTLRDFDDVLERRKTRAELREMYKILFGKATAGTNGDWLRDKVAYELQRRLRYSGGEPERVRARREALGDYEPETEAREELPRKRERDPRLPPVGTIIERPYGDTTVRLRIVEDSFELLDEDGRVRSSYKSISGAARGVCVCEVNGFVFFGLDSKRKGGTK